MNRLIRIAGGTASGKSTLSEMVAKEIGCILLSHDRYYVDIDKTEGFNFDEPNAMDNDLLVEHIALLINDKPAHLPIYDFRSHSRLSEREVCQPQPLIILEGILVMACNELDKYSSLDIYVDAPADIRFIRRLKRDVLTRGRSVESVTSQYLNTVRPMHNKHVLTSRKKAQLVIDGCAPIKDSVNQMVSAIQHLNQPI